MAISCRTFNMSDERERLEFRRETVASCTRTVLELQSELAEAKTKKEAAIAELEAEIVKQEFERGLAV